MGAPVTGDDEPITSINVIPFVDIVLVLLIVFMMTASFIIAPAVDVKLPRAKSGTEPPPRALHLVVDASGTVFADSKPIESDAIETLVRAQLDGNPDLHVLVSADRSVPYGEVVRLLDAVRSVGVSKFAISVESG